MQRHELYVVLRTCLSFSVFWSSTWQVRSNHDSSAGYFTSRCLAALLRLSAMLLPFCTHLLVQ